MTSNGFHPLPLRLLSPLLCIIPPAGHRGKSRTSVVNPLATAAKPLSRATVIHLAPPRHRCAPLSLLSVIFRLASATAASLVSIFLVAEEETRRSTRGRTQSDMAFG